MERLQNAARRRTLAVALAMTLLMSALLGVQGASAQEGDNADVTVTIGEVLDSGRSWVDGDGYHARDMIVTLMLSGAVESTETARLGQDWTGPCAEDGTSCKGALAQTLVIQRPETKAAWDGWNGLGGMTLSADGDDGKMMLVGRGANASTFLHLTSISNVADGSITYSGRMLTMNRPVEGFNMRGHFCFGLPGVPSGYVYTGGIDDSGSGFPHFPTSRLWLWPTPNGIATGEWTTNLTRGDLHIAFMNDARLFQDERGYDGFKGKGYFMILGGTGAYEGMIGWAHYNVGLLFSFQGPEVACAGSNHATGIVTV